MNGQIGILFSPFVGADGMSLVKSFVKLQWYDRLACHASAFKCFSFCLRHLFFSFWIERVFLGVSVCGVRGMGSNEHRRNGILFLPSKVQTKCYSGSR